jgi:hypothetical protein
MQLVPAWLRVVDPTPGLAVTPNTEDSPTEQQKCGGRINSHVGCAVSDEFARGWPPALLV